MSEVPSSAAMGEVSPNLARTLVRYVETALGPDGIDQLLEHLPQLDELPEMSTKWWSLEEFGQLIVAGYKVTGDADLGRRVGEQTLDDLLGGSMAELIAANGSVADACAFLAEYSTRLSAGRVLAVVESSDRHVIIEGRYLDGAAPSDFSCGFTRGFYTRLPVVFGQLATVAEVACQGRGDDTCLFRVAWRPDPSRADVTAIDPEERLVRGSTALEQIQAQHAMSARLVDSHDIDELLDRVVEQVSDGVGAPRYVLSVRLDDGVGRRVHQIGFEGDDAEVLADMLDAGEPLGDECLTVRIRHGDRVIGHLVAVFLPEATPTVVDTSLLRSYATYAASAIRIVEALDSATRDRDTARAMLALAESLAEPSGTIEVAQSLCAALPGATDCDLGSVWLPVGDSGTVQLVAATDRGGSLLPLPVDPVSFHLDELPLATALDRDPVFLDASDETVRRLAGSTVMSYTELAAVPIGADGRLLAVAVVGFHARVGDRARPAVSTRLRGLADQAAIAFQNAHLVESMRHQALHDDLTGLAKRVLAEDRCRLALDRRDRTGERVAVLFVDLDDFKVVNDTHGHHVGDHVLRELARRMSAQLRASDTCARIGGDEFVVILTSPPGDDGAEEVARRLLAALDEPVDTDGTSIKLSASIGIARAGEGPTTFDELVTRADDAMYQAKADGKARLVVATPVA